MDLPVYLDYNATTPLDPRVLEAMMPFFTTHFGNASSNSHAIGWRAAEAVKMAQEHVSGLIGSEPTEITFTSGATESVNLALRGLSQTYRSKGNHWITAKTEHHAVLDTFTALEKDGVRVTYLPVDGCGRVDLHRVKEAISPQTIALCFMYANNETGTVHPVRELAAVAREHGLIFFSDATQAVGKIPVDVQRDGIDLMAFSSHKMYGPKGVGALFARRRGPRVVLTPQITGGGQQNGVRSGTLNVSGIVGFGKACEICANEMEQEGLAIRNLRNELESALLAVGNVVVNGDVENRLPNVSNVSFSNWEARGILKEIRSEIAVSSGSACTSAQLAPSHVIRAMHNEERAGSAIRFSLGRMTTPGEVDYVIERMKHVMDQLKLKP